jgi:hypothetical protein
VGGGWRRLHNEELHSLYASPNTIRAIISRKVRWARHNILTGKPEAKRRLGRPRYRWKDNIITDLREIW